MFCELCKIDKPVRYHSGPHPILECGHGVFPPDSEEKLLQDLNETLFDEIEQRATATCVSIEEAQQQITTEDLAALAPRRKLNLLRTLHDEGISTLATQQAEQRLGKASRRFVTRDS
jgi:hypothetical protein